MILDLLEPNFDPGRFVDTTTKDVVYLNIYEDPVIQQALAVLRSGGNAVPPELMAEYLKLVEEGNAPAQTAAKKVPLTKEEQMQKDVQKALDDIGNALKKKKKKK